MHAEFQAENMEMKIKLKRCRLTEKRVLKFILKNNGVRMPTEFLQQLGSFLRRT